ncbi:MAG: 50S ribosomal protein L24, partial [Promethearchaeota archaeon]
MKVSSRKPSKQRKARYKVKHHQVSKLLTARVDEIIRSEWGVKRLPIRKDDMVRVLSGEFRDIEGKVLEIRKKDRKIV